MSRVVRNGSKATVFTKASSWTPACDPLPDNEVADNSGCGQRHVPWFAEPADVNNKLTPYPAAFAPLSMTAQCPGSDVTLRDRSGNVYPAAAIHLADSKFRRLIASKHGKLAASGHQAWHASHSFGGLYTKTASSSVRWKLTFVRVS